MKGDTTMEIEVIGKTAVVREKGVLIDSGSSAVELLATVRYETGCSAVILSKEQLDRRILRDFEENKNKQFGNALGRLLQAPPGLRPGEQRRPSDLLPARRGGGAGLAGKGVRA